MDQQLTEEDLKNLQCEDISIQILPNGKDVLILVCKEKDGCNRLSEILHSHAFDLKIFINESSDNYELVFEFIDDDIVFKIDSGKNEANYPPLGKLKNNKIKYITTGVWAGRTPQGRTCHYSTKLLRLGKHDPAESFKQAKEVQFVPGESENEPPVVILIYETYDHIFEAEADEAYNNLIEKTKGNPFMEISEAGEHVNLKIWDILIELEVDIAGLKYSPAQLDDFLKKADSSESFAFVLGLPAVNGESAAIAVTKREGFEIITLSGFTHKKG